MSSTCPSSSAEPQIDPGDVIVLDADGAVVVPKADRVDEVASAALERETARGRAPAPGTRQASARTT